MKILIVKPSSLGDVVQALPVLRLLRRHYPQSEIHWCVETTLAPLLYEDPDLSGLFLFDRKRFASPAGWPLLWQTIGDMRKESFDLVIDLQGLFRSGALSWLANGAMLAGVGDPREGAHGFYDISVPRPSYYTHAVDWYLAVLKRLGIPVCFDFEWLPKNTKAAQSVEVKWQPGHAQWVVLQPGARWVNKRWPLECYAETIRSLLAEAPDLRFAILGSSADYALGNALAQDFPASCLDLTGQTSLREMVEWIRRASVMVTNDTGPMHIAAALKTPLVALFGPTEPRRTGPYGQLQNVLQSNLDCVPCMKTRCVQERDCDCLGRISLGTVASRVLAHLGSKPPKERYSGKLELVE